MLGLFKGVYRQRRTQEILGNIHPDLKKKGGTSEIKDIKSGPGYRKRNKIILCHDRQV